MDIRKKNGRQINIFLKENLKDYNISKKRVYDILDITRKFIAHYLKDCYI